MSYRCNGCNLERLREEYGDKLVHVRGSWYVQGDLPCRGQGEPISLGDQPIRFVAWFMSTDHACGRTAAKDTQFHGEEYEIPRRR